MFSIQFEQEKTEKITFGDLQPDVLFVVDNSLYGKVNESSLIVLSHSGVPTFDFETDINHDWEIDYVLPKPIKINY